MRINDVHGKAAQLDAMAARGDAIAEFVVVAEIVDERFEAADFGEMPFRGGHHRAEHEIELPPQEPRDEDARREIRAIAESLEVGGEPAVSEPAVKTCDAADGGIRERGGDRAEKTRIDAHVAIADDDDFVARFADHAAKLVDLVARSKRVRTNQQTNRALGEIGNQFANDRNRRRPDRP